ncbi:MAG: hypothetical protein GY841_14850 [FCB group bacterium]|nr:hypothetical protein [FCB group bacterium]
MEYRQLENSEVTVSPVTYGGWAIGGWMWEPQDHADALDFTLSDDELALINSQLRELKIEQ